MEQSTTKLLSSLNEKQREAVVCELKRILVLAGAGSGKTKTLLQKLLYLIEEKSVSASNILGITFTKNAANEMIDRLIVSTDNSGEYKKLLNSKNITKKDLEIRRHQYVQKYNWINNLTLKTFHSLCYHILRDYGVSEFDNQFKILTDSPNLDPDYEKFSAGETSMEILHKRLTRLCAQKREYLLDLKRYILDYYVDRIHVQENTSNNYEKYKFYTSLNGTKVRSKSEQYIADWLFRHNIPFEYETEVNFGDFPFKPDFYIPTADIFLEHVSNKSYPTKSKEDQFKKAGKTLVKTYEHQTRDTSRFNQFLEKAIKNKLPSDYEYSTSLSFEEEFKHYHSDIKKYLVYVLRVIDMIKVENLPMNKIFNNAKTDQHERVREFYRLAKPLIDDYNTHCINKSYLDFNDLIIKTIDLFKNRPEIADKFRSEFKYILVDEFQDVNNLQVELIDLLLTDENQLFCVGDDWQSIYGFRGSNVDYIVNFSKHFPDSKTIKLNLNYRSTENIVGASNEVIKNNKFQLNKPVQSSKKSSSKVVVFAGNNPEENLNFVVDQVRSLQQEKNYTADDILFLYRRTKMFEEYKRRFKKEALKVSFKTIHASKGLEAKAVFIIGLTEGSGGFPDVWMDDRIYQIIKESKHDLLLEEERRLFYVALTRAKDELFLITEKGCESSFLQEIPKIFTRKVHKPLRPAVEKIALCGSCQSKIEEIFSFCPYCGTEILGSNISAN